MMRCHLASTAGLKTVCRKRLQLGWQMRLPGQLLRRVWLPAQLQQTWWVPLPAFLKGCLPAVQLLEHWVERSQVGFSISCQKACLYCAAAV